ncbi:peptide ABC transporter permease [Marinitoga sp. 1135]|uniref:ABC-type dipeptide/oligopeptide/nickel transport system, permease component n=1 Tax=Marinitoga piezophila (strain DSM 14283 / JCM 11233 / KA3) TaxID=443254 RepID=H2J7W7_MARPK|nr:MULTISPECIES: ABC transporter permease [Marinitoga]AEX85458.1 ABC-type dipeptide/oligopeptide/nickel transport system, permease component [Marinitoga piezophila KA3]APT75933.1 peptide ABC transporter permease [Marinitoga sp. 1137]NUU95676.1 peptide ABC transporter permease [Marinitoga sp. 1135]NUU97608.1 peptide ABC transporter permease [Marinitoga sp. 1138]
MTLKEKIKNNDYLYFMLRNKKVLFGFFVFLFFLLLGLVGPHLSKYGPLEYAGPGYMPPGKEYWLGTDIFGHDVYTQLVYGLRSSYFVGFFGGTLATIIGLFVGFLSGYKGKWVDELLMMLTNVMLVIPTLAILIIISSYLSFRGMVFESIIIGITNWPWTARAIRSLTMSIKNKEFVNLSRISSLPTGKIIIEDIASNMFSYIFMVFILQFAGAVLSAVTLDFIGLGPTKGISLGLMMQIARDWNAVQLGMWWWAIIPGLVITLLVSSLYFINTGLDEVFNPKLREM